MRWEPGGPAAIGAALVPVTSFVYQNVGFTATVRASLLPDRKIWVEGQVEDSSSASAPAAETSHSPVIAIFQQEIDAVLDEGRPLIVGRVDDASGRTLYMEVGARLLE